MFFLEIPSQMEQMKAENSLLGQLSLVIFHSILVLMDQSNLDPSVEVSQ